VDLRELKALEIAARTRIEFVDGTWRVPSQHSPDRKYHVVLTGEVSCTCEDFQLRRQPCKHIHAARLVQERDHGDKAPAIDTSAVPKRPTYKQDWPKYNQGQITEKRRLYVLLRELCEGIEELPEPEGKRGRKPTPLRDMIFACGVKVYSGFSSRRFGSDLLEAFEKGFLVRPLHPNKINCYLENPAITPILHKLIEQSSLPLRAVETVFAPDSTGFSTSRFVRWYDEKYGTTRSGHDWVKAHAICGVKTNIVTAVIIEDRDAADCPQFKPLVEATAKNFQVDAVPADKAYLSRENLELLDKIGGTAFVPFKCNSVPGEAGTVWERMFFYFQFRREEFLKHYHQRSNAESTFGMVKAKFGDAVRSRTDTAMKNEVLVKFLLHNVCVVHQSHIELGIEPVFWKEERQEEPERGRDVLPMTRPG
jgi:transposase